MPRPAPPPAARSTPFRFAVGVALFVGAFVGALALVDREVIPRVPDLAGEVLHDLPDELPALARADGRVLYLGDSVVHSISRRDRDRRPLTEMVADLSGLPVVDATRAASAVDRYLAELRLVAHLGRRPLVALVAVNPRSFAPSWARNPGWRFRRDNAMIWAPLRTRALAVFGWDFEPLTVVDWEASPVVVDGRLLGTVASLMDPASGLLPDDDAVRGRYLVRYASDIERSPRVPEFEAILAWAADEAPFPVLFYVTPIDTMLIERLLDDAGRDAVADNLARLGAAFRRADVPWLDLSRLVPAAGFDHLRAEPHEHLRDSGRLAVAEAIAPALRAQAGPDAPSGPRPPSAR